MKREFYFEYGIKYSSKIMTSEFKYIFKRFCFDLQKLRFCTFYPEMSFQTFSISKCLPYNVNLRKVISTYKLNFNKICKGYNPTEKPRAYVIDIEN